MAKHMTQTRICLGALTGDELQIRNADGQKSGETLFPATAGIKYAPINYIQILNVTLN